jgi:hypothetical protein
MTREISSIKARLKDVGKSKKASSEDEDSNVQDNAGNQFGGRKRKKQKKSRSARLTDWASLHIA